MNKKILIYAIGLLLLVACDNSLNCVDVDFSVSASSVVVCPGDTVTFNFDGNPDYIVFWSGEQFSDYDFRYGRTLRAGVEYDLVFNSQVLKGSQPGQLSLLVSNDFNGDYDDYENIIRTKWIDMTPEMAWASGKDGVSSGKLSLTDYLTDDQNLYLAFRYRTKNQAEYGVASNWVIGDLNIFNGTEDFGDVVLYDMSNAGFRVVDPFMRTETAGNCAVSGSLLSFMGPLGVEDSSGQLVYPLMESEQWIISSPLKPSDIIEMGPDRPKAIKGFTQKRVSTYTHVYNEPGVYKAVFVASTQTISDKSEVIKSIEIEVSDEIY